MPCVSVSIHRPTATHISSFIGPSGVRALPLAAGINEAGHYFGPSGVCALPLAAGINEGGHYFRHFFPLLLVVVLTTAIQNHRRGYRRVSNFCMGS